MMSWLDQLPVLVVVIPLLAAPLCVVLDRPLAGWLTALAASIGAFAVSVLLLQQTGEVGTISYHIGGWAPPWGIELRIDQLNAYVLLIVTSIAVLALLFGKASVEQEIASDKAAGFYAAFLLLMAGLVGMTITGDAFNVFVFLEISSLASYALISMGKDRRALTAAFQYLVMGTLGASFILIGIGFLYMMTGTLNMADLAERIPAVADTRTVRAGFAFLMVGIGLKLAMFPLHLWLPNAYAYAPSVVSVFIAATATKVAVYILLRFVLSIFGLSFSLGDMPLNLILLALGMVGVISASLVAVFQENVKRMLAYSSVAQIGYMLLGIGLATTEGIGAAILHLFNHALMKAALFMALGAVMYRIGTVNLSDFAGLGRRMPWTTAAIALGGLSLIGVPPTVGFISKWYLVTAILDLGYWPIAVLVLFGSLLALIYIWRLVEKAYLSTPDGEIKTQEAPLSMLIPIWILIFANVYFGIETDVSVGVAQQAAEALTGLTAGGAQ